MSNANLSTLDMLQSGVHFGHKASKKHPKMDPYIFGIRNQISIIDLDRTKERIEATLPVLEELAAQHKIILFLGTKRQAQTLVKAAAEKLEMPYIVERWLGGLLTNFHSVNGLMRKLTTLKEGRDNGEWETRYNKKERLVLEREIQRLDQIVGGIESMDRLPDALFVVDCNKESTAIREANRMKIPVFAMNDTNTNPSSVTYAIPANDDGTKSITYVLNLVIAAIEAGKKRAVEVAPELNPTKAPTPTTEDNL